MHMSLLLISFLFLKAVAGSASDLDVVLERCNQAQQRCQAINCIPAAQKDLVDARRITEDLLTETHNLLADLKTNIDIIKSSQIQNRIDINNQIKALNLQLSTLTRQKAGISSKLFGSKKITEETNSVTSEIDALVGQLRQLDGVLDPFLNSQKNLGKESLKVAKDFHEAFALAELTNLLNKIDSLPPHKPQELPIVDAKATMLAIMAYELKFLRSANFSVGFKVNINGKQLILKATSWAGELTLTLDSSSSTEKLSDLLKPVFDNSLPVSLRTAIERDFSMGSIVRIGSENGDNRGNAITIEANDRSNTKRGYETIMYFLWNTLENGSLIIERSSLAKPREVFDGFAEQRENGFYTPDQSILRTTLILTDKTIMR